MTIEQYLETLRQYSFSGKLSFENESVQKGLALSSRLGGSLIANHNKAQYLLAMGKYEKSLNLYLKEYERYRDVNDQHCRDNWNDMWIRPNTILNIKLIIGPPHDLQALDILYYLVDFSTNWVSNKLSEFADACNKFIDEIKAKSDKPLLMLIANANISNFSDKNITADSIITEIWPILHYLPDNKKSEIPLLKYKGVIFNQTVLEAPFEDKDFIQFLKKIARRGENHLREKYEVPKIGESWISETQLYRSLEKHYVDYEVEHHGQPAWLSPQHLDIFFPKNNIGLEYQGKQHFEPVEFFGGEDAFKKTLERDKKKEKLCKENKCKLIYVLPNYDLNEVIQKIDKFLKT